MTDEINDEHMFKVIENFFKNKGLVYQQIEHFNDFINNGIQSVIDEEPSIEIVPKKDTKYTINFTEAYVYSPGIIEEDRNLKNITPQEARRRDLTYDSAICCDVTETMTEDCKIINTTTHKRIIIGRIPIMIRSDKCILHNKSDLERIQAGECEKDNGGYFIIKGNERVIVSQLRSNYNQPMVLKQKPKDGQIYSFIATIRSMSETTGHSVQLRAMIGLDDRTICFSLPYIKEPVPVGVVFKALGYTLEKDILNFINLSTLNTKKYMKIIIRDSFFISTQREALEYIGTSTIHTISKDKRYDYTKQVCEIDLFPHLGLGSTNFEICTMLGFIVNQLISTRIGLREVDDLDNFSNKRIESTGVLFTELFRTLYKKFINTVKLIVEKKKTNFECISVIKKCNGITAGIKHSMSTGNWGAQKNSYIRTGVSQVISRITYAASLSHTRRIIIPVGKESKNAKIRQIHSSQFGYICPAETPEGKSAGIVLNFALLSRSTIKISTFIVKDILKNIKFLTPTSEINIDTLPDFKLVFLNGAIIGGTKNPEDMVREIIDLRRNKQLDKDVSVSYDTIDDIVRVFCDAGRASRPLLRIDDNGIMIKKSSGVEWDNLIKNNLIEYIDCSEIQNYVVAMTPDSVTKWKNDFCEIHPSMMQGVMGSVIPFPDHSPSPRNCYQCSMGKQAIGVFSLAHNIRFDTIVHVLDYPQRPMVSTKQSDFMGFNEMPSGINVIVAVLSYTGYNQEDSLILNKSSIDRGLFTLTSYRTICEVDTKIGMYTSKTIEMPPRNSNGLRKEDPEYFMRKKDNYSLLDSRGIVREGTKINKGDVIIGKINRESSKSGVEKITDCSICAKQVDEGVIDKVDVTTTPNGYLMVKIKIRQHRIPEIGDKFASRAAQKGTVGAIYSQEDMPFNSDGISPDIIINPHAFPSRMTVNQLMECVLGKACCIGGMYGDSTPFTSSSSGNAAERICDLLAKAGMDNKASCDRTGWEQLYNGMTGDPIKAKVFMGPTYYQRLKHMVVDKMHSRAQGHVTTLTRQPLEGRSRDGGLRFGEMERDCMIAYGASRFLKERLFDCSDPYTIIVCDHCGMITPSQSECLSCRKDDVTSVNMPYASKLVCMELMAMGIKIAIKPKK
jgi:DNA-directed RNA polymerase II subunit RPB2